MPPKKKIEEPILVTPKVEVTAEELLKQLEIEREARRVAEEKLDSKVKAEIKVRDPLSGPGKLCEAVKITAAEAWQLGKEIYNTPDGRQDMRLKQCPEGYQVRQGANAYYIVGVDNKDPEKNELIPNCRSKYTKEYEYRMKKPASFAITEAPPEGRVHLCDHHAHVLLGKAECFCRNCNPPKKEEVI
jgi:hypothetical protein